MSDATVQETPAAIALDGVLRELRAIRTFLPRIAHIIDIQPERDSEAWQSVQGAMAQLDDCIDRLEHPDEECSCAATPNWRMTSEHGRIDPDCPVHGIKDEQPTIVQQIEAEAHRAWKDSIADDRRDDLMADADRSEYAGEGR